MPMPRAGEGIWLWVPREALAERGCALRRREFGIGIIPAPWMSRLSLPALPSCWMPGAGCWHSPGPPKNTSWDKDAPARQQEVGGGSERYLGSLGVPRGADWLCPSRASVSPRRGRDLAWLPAWPPRLEFLLCACCAAPKVLWESKYSSPRRLQAGCSLSPAAGEGHRERGCARAGGDERGCSTSVLSPLSRRSHGAAAGTPLLPLLPQPRDAPHPSAFTPCPRSVGRADPRGGPGDPRVRRGPLSSGRGPGVFCRAAGPACGGEGRCDEHSSHI